MASIHKQRKKKNWFCAFTTPDGKRHFKSTGTSNKPAAKQICRAWEAATLHGTDLTIDRAREIISRGVADALLAAGHTLPSSTVRDWCGRWLAAKEIENEPTTYVRYELTIRQFLKAIGSKADKRLEALTPDIILKFRDDCVATRSVGSTNTNLRIIRACLNSARLQGLLPTNPASLVKTLRERGESNRREMTLEEIRRVLETCGSTPWRGLVLTGLYCGQRLKDCARLTWSQVDLVKKTIWFSRTVKTYKRLSMALAAPLHDYLASLPSSDDPASFVFPRFAELAEPDISPLSRAFAEEILIPSGLMPPRSKNHASTNKGRDARRGVNEVTFHSLRHSFTTLLRSTGASSAIAEMIVGHDSPAMNRHYTHLHADDTTEAISKLPDVTKPDVTK